MTVSIIALIITNIISPIITGVVTFLLTRKRYNVDVQSAETDKMNKALDFYTKFCESSKNQMDSIVERNNQLIEVNSKLLERNDKLEERNDRLEKEVAELKDQVLRLTMSICLDLTCKHRVQYKKTSMDE